MPMIKPITAGSSQPRFRSNSGRYRFASSTGASSRRQRFHKIKDRSSPCEDHDGNIHGAVVPEELPGKRQNDKCDGGRVDEHKHGDGIFDDGTQTHVGNGKGKQREQNCPDLVRNFAVCHFDKCFRAGGHEADGGLETGEGDGDGENDLADTAEIMARDLRQGNAAIVGDLEQSARLCAHENRNDINYRHQNAGQYAGAQHVNGNRVVIVNAYAADDVDDDNAEGKACDGVHGAVALDKGREERACFSSIRLSWCNGRNGCAGIQQCGDHEHGQEQQKDRIDDLANPDRDFARTQREEQHECEEDS